MKKTTVILLTVFLISSAAVWSQEAKTFTEPAFRPVTPEVIAQGDSFVAVARGYNSLFTNPAGFARKGGSLTLASVGARAYLLPDETFLNGELDSAMTSLDSGDTAAMVNALARQITQNGLGANFSSGLGLVGGGLGLGLAVEADAYARGENALGTTVNANVTGAFIGGLAFPMNIMGGKLYVGGDVRLMYRVEAREVGIVDFAAFAMGSDDPNAPAPDFPVLHGVAPAFDMGVIYENGGLTAGAALRDIFGSKFAYGESGVMAIVDSGELPPVENPLEDNYVIPTTLSVGFGLRPIQGPLRFLLDPTIHAEYRAPLGVEKVPSFFTSLHAGAEVKVLSFIKVRGGINQGYLTAGAGVKLLFLDVNVAAFTREMGRYTPTKPNSGVTVEAAIRF